jgi:hypothetical protein
VLPAAGQLASLGCGLLGVNVLVHTSTAVSSCHPGASRKAIEYVINTSMEFKFHFFVQFNYSMYGT